MDKKQEKMEFWKGRQGKQKIKRNRKKRRFLKQAFWGNKVEKTSKIAGKLPFRAFFNNTKAQKHRGQKNKTTQNNKKQTKNTILHFGKQPPISVKFLCFQVTLFHVCKAVCGWKHYKNSVSSRTQLWGITDSKARFEAPSQNGTFATKSAILGFPMCLLKSLFL